MTALWWRVELHDRATGRITRMGDYRDQSLAKLVASGMRAEAQRRDAAIAIREIDAPTKVTQ